jgi:hypothetical protein
VRVPKGAGLGRISLATTLVVLAWGTAGCGSGSWGRRSAGPVGLGVGHRQDPALSGDGRLLASVVERGGRATVLLQEQPSGREIPLRHLGRFQPHRSPSLSWNGRYLALVVQQGNRKLAVIEDRATGQLLRLPLPGDPEVERLSLAPNGRRLALQVVRNGTARVQVLNLSNLLEPDLPAGPVGPGGPGGLVGAGGAMAPGRSLGPR